MASPMVAVDEDFVVDLYCSISRRSTCLTAARFRADLDDFEVVFLARLERSGAFQGSGGGAMHGRALVAPAFVLDFGVVAKRFDVLAEFHKGAEGGDARYFAFNELSDFVSLEPIAPDVVDLLDTEGDAAILRVDL